VQRVFFKAELSTAERTALLVDVVRSRELINAGLVELSTAERTALFFDVVRSREFSNTGLVEPSTAEKTASSDAKPQIYLLYSVHYRVN
jgi:hypothetical protein